MKAAIGARLLSSSAVRPKPKPFELVDRDLRGFRLRVQPSGEKSYTVQYTSGRPVTIGAVGDMSSIHARERAEKILGNIGSHPVLPVMNVHLSIPHISEPSGPLLRAGLDTDETVW